MGIRQKKKRLCQLRRPAAKHPDPENRKVTVKLGRQK
jgi:hypothetical protein